MKTDDEIRESEPESIGQAKLCGPYDNPVAAELTRDDRWALDRMQDESDEPVYTPRAA
ncbi:hypothetical protein [Arthrobacter sp. A2-55]|uniref:hypothetical protein n=1 Tax=Arthrobacter sp. A2-55 TaxID=2897337 RepID=UPI0021CD94D7|nr:hypothetical protein [Arthrobacter sp. A2-55]MCU6481288.1 hypothetical protein [Arthrobacter sp. A2-55]